MTVTASLPSFDLTSAEDFLLRAIAHHQAGDFQYAEQLYRTILRAQPRHPDANHNLGVLALQMRQPTAALSHLKIALDADPNRRPYWLSYIDALIQAGELDLARQTLTRGVQLGLHGDAVDALAANLGIDARFTLQAAGPTPQEIEALSALFREKRFEEAAGSARTLTERFPLNGYGWKALGVMLKMLGHESADTLVHLRRAVELLPNDAEAHSNLGLALRESGLSPEAEAACRQAITLNSEFAEAHFNLALALQDQGKYADAEASYHRAIDIRPDYAEAHYNLGINLQNLDRLAEAEVSYRRALDIDPNFVGAHNNLGGVLKDYGRLEEALACYRRVLAIKPDNRESHSNLVFILDLVEGCTVEQQQAERRRWYEQHGRRFAAAIRPHDNTPDPSRKLRIGYVSADFRRHSAYYAFSPVILHHDRGAFEVVCYSESKLEDDATARLRQAVHEWRRTAGVSDDALAEQIRRDRIDILVDLSGHSAGNRLLVFARKPAPVQVAAWGATSTGVQTIDYYFADPVAVPPEQRHLYAEEVLDLPCILCYEPPEYLPEISALPALGSGSFTFGCINRVEKITDRMIALWGQIFAQLPQARLLLKDRACDDAKVKQQLLHRLGAAGIATERVRILGRSQHAEHLKAFQAVDVGLDPYPQGGGISTAEALWMGVPVVSMIGPTVPSRVTPSILTGLGMAEWIAHSDEEYVRIAVKAARDLQALAHLRANLRARLATSPLSDVKRYARATESLYRSIWQRWCAKQRPKTNRKSPTQKN